MLVEFERATQAQVHARCMNVELLEALVGFNLHATTRNCGFDISVGEDHILGKKILDESSIEKQAKRIDNARPMGQRAGMESLAEELLADNTAEKLNNDEMNKMRVQLQMRHAINRCKALLNSDLFSRKTRESYADMLEDLTNNEREGLQMITQNIGWIKENIAEIRSYKREFKDQLSHALESKWISEADSKHWQEYFYDENLLEWDRKEWLRNTFPTYCHNWKKVADDRVSVVDKANKLGLSTSDIPELAKVESTTQFLSMNYEDKKDIVLRLNALIEAHVKNKETFVHDLQNELTSWAAAGLVHETKIGKWMNAAMQSENPEAFVKNILLPLKQNWQVAAARFGQLNFALSAQSLPHGFKPATQNEFILMNDEQRISYLAVAELRLKDAQEADKTLVSARARIRHSLDTKDWEGAEEELKTAHEQWPNDEEFQAISSYIEAHKPKTEAKETMEKTPDPQEVNQDIRLLLRNLDGETYETHAWACTRGPEKAEALFNMMYNHLWEEETAQLQAKEHRTANEPIIVAQREEAPEQDEEESMEVTTKEVIETRQIIAEQAEEEEDERTKSMTFESLTFERHRRIVKGLHNPLKRKLRELDKLGYRYSVTGDPRPKKEYATKAQAV